MGSVAGVAGVVGVVGVAALFWENAVWEIQALDQEGFCSCLRREQS